MSSVATEVPNEVPGSEEEPHGWDWWLVGITFGLASLGLIMILSASSLSADAIYGNTLHFVTRQGIGLIGGIILSMGVLLLPYRWMRAGAMPTFLVVLAAQLLVLTPLAHTAKGAARWIKLGPVNLQPSELGKIALILVLADFLSRNEGRLRDFAGVAAPGLLLPVSLILFILPQKDFGTTVILLGLTGVMYFVAGLQWRYILGGVVAGIMGLAVLVAMEPYRMKRLVSFLDPFSDPDGAGYQVVQGWIALATGGWTGSGLASGVAQRGFLPEAHTDFISAVIGEELGVVGWLLVIALQIGVVWRATHIANRSPDLFGNLVCIGIAALLGAQAIINLGVVVGLMPAKGLVLPFLSYGSSAVMAHTLCIGILLRISHAGVADAAPRG